MVRIKDIAQQLGVSSTTVSNVIHGKSKKASPELVAKIQEALARENYVPNMAGVLLAQNSSKIIGIVLNNKVKYGDKLLQDPFISEILGGLEESITDRGYFTMLHNTRDIMDAARIVTMWNLDGVILIGFDKADYDDLCKKINKPFITVDGYFDTEVDNFVNVGINDFDGGYKMAKYLVSMGHKQFWYVADSHIGCEEARINGIKKCMEEEGLSFTDANCPIISSDENERMEYIKNMAQDILDKKNPYTAVFFASDRYAIEAMNHFQDCGIRIPEDISIVGFDDTAYASIVRPYLTTVRQDILLKSVVITNTLMNVINKYEIPSNTLKLPVEVIERNSVKKI